MMGRTPHPTGPGRPAGAPWAPQAVVLVAVALLAVLVGRVVVDAPDLLHVRLEAGLVGLLALAAVLALSVLLFLRGRFALVFLVGVIYLHLSTVLVRYHDLPSFLQLLVVPVLLGALAARPRAELRRLAGQPLTWLLAAYTLVLLASTMYARDTGLADARVVETGKAFALYLVVVLLLRSAARVRLAAWTMLAAGALLSALSVLQVATGELRNTFGGFARVKQAHIYGDVFEARIAGPLGDPNFFAQILLVLVPVGLALAWRERTAARRLLGYGMVGLITTASVLTYSRGGALALALVTALSLLAHGIRWQRLAVAGVSLLVAATLLLPSGFVQRLTTIQQILEGEEVLDLDSSFEERLLLMGTAWETFLANPVLGVGAGNYTVRFNEYAARFGSVARDYQDPDAVRYPHNLYLEVAAETGAVGLAVFGAALAVALLSLGRSAARLRQSGDLGTADLARGFQIALLGYLASSLFLHGDFQRYLWLLLAMAAGIEILRPGGSVRVVRERPGPPPPPDAPEDRGRPEPRASPRVRRQVAVLVSRFPKVTETFILREIIEMERQGQPVRLVPLLREPGPVVHPEARPWVERALYTPFASAPILAANVRALFRRPLPYLSLVGRLVAGSLTSPRGLAGTLAIFPKSVYLAERLRAEGISHVHAHFATHPTTAALIISELAGIGFSFTIHAHDLLSSRHRALLGIKLRRARFVRLISRFNQDYLRSLHPEADPRKLHVVHVGIDPSLYGGGHGVATERGEGAGPPRLLTVAGFRPYKGLPVLVEACRLLRDRGVDFRCEIIGDGPLRSEIERRIADARLQDRVRLLGARPQGEVRERLADRPIFVLPSVILRDGWMEGIPVALMEAMAAGSPVIASRLSGIPELVEDGVSGLLVAPGEPERLASAIERLAGAPELAARLGAEGRRVVEREFHIERCVAELLHLVDPQAMPALPGGVAAAALRLSRTAGVGPPGVRRLLEGPDAVVAELVLPGGEVAGTEILKLHRDFPGAARPAVDRARHEFTVLGELAERMRGPDGRELRAVPRPLGFDEESAAVLMEACRGENLVSRLRAARLASARGGSGLGEDLERVGAWLRLMQEATAGMDGAAALDALATETTEDLERCRPFLGDSLADRVARRRDALLDELSRASFEAVGCHSDLWPGNVFVGPDGVQVIDLEGFRPGLRGEDATYFLLQLEGYFDYPLLRRRFPPLAGAFLSGWGGGPLRNGPADRLARLAKPLQILARAGGRGLRGRRRRQRLARRAAEALA